MFRKLTVLTVLAISFFPGCAGLQANEAGTTATTSGIIDSNAGPRFFCTNLRSVCVLDTDCCSRSCIKGACQE